MRYTNSNIIVNLIKKKEKEKIFKDLIRGAKNLINAIKRDLLKNGQEEIKRETASKVNCNNKNKYL